MPSERLDFSERANVAELMDGPCTYAEFRDCVHDLEQCNRLLLASRPTLQWLRQFAGQSVRPLHIVDVGFGAGDMLRRIRSWADAHRLPVKLTGIDLNPHAARAAAEFAGGNSGIEWVVGDAFSYKAQEPIDIVLSSLFTHHLEDRDIVNFLRWMERVAARGWFVNDLHRMKLFYRAFSPLATAMRWHPFVRHDGPVSVRRSFVRADWKRYCAAAAIPLEDVSIVHRQPARLCVGRVKQ